MQAPGTSLQPPRALPRQQLVPTARSTFRWTPEAGPPCSKSAGCSEQTAGARCFRKSRRYEVALCSSALTPPDKSFTKVDSALKNSRLLVGSPHPAVSLSICVPQAPKLLRPAVPTALCPKEAAGETKRKRMLRWPCSPRCFRPFLPTRGRLTRPCPRAHALCQSELACQLRRLVLSLGNIWLFIRSLELQLGLASLEVMWPP